MQVQQANAGRCVKRQACGNHGAIKMERHQRDAERLAAEVPLQGHCLRDHLPIQGGVMIPSSSKSALFVPEVTKRRRHSTRHTPLEEGEFTFRSCAAPRLVCVELRHLHSLFQGLPRVEKSEQRRVFLFKVSINSKSPHGRAAAASGAAGDGTAGRRSRCAGPRPAISARWRTSARASAPASSARRWRRSCSA